MKRTLFILLALAAFLPASADRYLTFGENDTLKVCPSREDNTQRVTVRAHFDGRLDQWYMTLNLPQGVRLVDFERSVDMLYIPYWNQSGERSYCSASLFMNESDEGATVILSSSITTPGYWDMFNNGLFDHYGTVKWEAGDYEQMCVLTFQFEGSLQDEASIGISDYLRTTPDQRGFTIPDTYWDRTICLYWAYRPGDVDGNGKVTIADVAMLIDLVLIGEASQSEDIQNAADVNRDGQMGIADVTALIDRILLAS